MGLSMEVMTALKDFKLAKDEIRRLKMDLNGLQREWNEMKAEVERLRVEVTSLQIRIANHDNAGFLNHIENSVKEQAQMIFELREALGEIGLQTNPQIMWKIAKEARNNT